LISACYLILIKGFVIGVQFLMSRAYQTLNFHNMKIARRWTCAIFMKISSLWSLIYLWLKDYYRISLPNRILLSTIMKSDLNYLNFTSFGEFSINCAWFQSLKTFQHLYLIKLFENCIIQFKQATLVVNWVQNRHFKI
jgi:hypothetical protein